MPSVKRSYAGAVYARRRWRRDLWTALTLGVIAAGLTAAGIYLLYMRQKF